MGMYLNPRNSGFEEVLNGDYIDKTGLIALINQRINTPSKLVCISRPRRFGKSYAAKMLCAYYDYTCDSHSLFEKYEEAVAKAIDEIRQMNYAPTYYNDEQALRYVIKFANIVCVDNYMKIEELPSGKGIADVVFIPRKATDPTLVIELKWNKSDTAAIQQIKDRVYPTILKNRKGKIILVGINYDEKTKVHTCKIETVTK